MGKPSVKSIPTTKSNKKIITKKFKDEIKKLLESKVSEDKTVNKRKKIDKEEATSSKLIDKNNSKTNSNVKKNLNLQSNLKNGTTSKNGDKKKVLKDVKIKKDPTKEKVKKTSTKNKSESSKSRNAVKIKNSQNGKTETKKPIKKNPSLKTNGSTNVKKISNDKLIKSKTKTVSDNKKSTKPPKRADPDKVPKKSKTKKNDENFNLKNGKKSKTSSKDAKSVKSMLTNKKSVKKVESKTEKKVTNKKSLTATSNSSKSNNKKIKPGKVQKDSKPKLKNIKTEKSLNLKRKAGTTKSKDLKRMKCDCAPNIKPSSSEIVKKEIDENMIAKFIIKNIINEDKKNLGSNASDDDSDASRYIDQFFDAEDNDDCDSEKNSESSSESDEDISDESSDSDLSDVNENDMSLDQLIKEYGNSENNTETQLVKYVNNKSEEESDEEDDEDYECDLSTSDSYSDGSGEDDDDDSDKGNMNNGNNSNSDDSNDDNEEYNSSDEWEDLEYSGENLNNILKHQLKLQNFDSTVDGSSDLSFSSYHSDSIDTDYRPDDNNIDSDSNEVESDDDLDSADDTDSENDTDYVPDDDYVEDLIIQHGNAKIYDANDNNISFNSNSPQIFEINNDHEVASQVSEDSCPQLIKIDDCNSINGLKELVNTDIFETNNETTLTEYKDFLKAYAESNENDFSVTTVDMPEHSDMHSNEESYSELSNSDLYEEVSTEDEYTSEDSEETEEYNEHDYYEEDESDVEEYDINKFKCYESVNCQQVLLHISDRVILHGCMKIQLLVGSVEILGYTMKQNETKEIFSPRGNTFLCITPMEPATTNQIINEQIDSLKLLFLDEDLQDIKENFNQITDSLILAEPITDNKKIFMIKNYMKQKVFPTVNDIGVDRSYYTCEYLLKTLIYTNYQRKLIYNLEWENIAVSKDSKLLLTGGKSVGKSTLLRYLINKNINEHKKILLIDLDIGQTEVFLPETVSATVIDQPLLGPGYLHNLKPDKSYLYGDFSINSCPIKYIMCVYNLLKFCNANPEYQHMPWIINTMGYTKGFGMEIISIIIKLLSPTNVVQIQNINRKIENYSNDLTAEFINKMRYNILNKEIKDICNNKNLILNYNLTKISSMVNKRKDVSGWEISSIDLRTIYILSHLSKILAKCNSNWLTDVKPIVGSLKTLKIHLSSNIEVSPEFIHKILNANIVFLCNKIDVTDDSTLECAGLGIVRGIDKFADKIYLLSPLEFHEMLNVNTLAIGTTPIPSSLILIQSSSVQGKVPYVYNGRDFIGSKHVQSVYKSDIQIST